MTSIPFNNLKPLYIEMAEELREAVDRVLASGWYVLGPEVEALEAQLSNYLGGPDVVGVANGTDAIELTLRAAKIGPGDEVITVAHTAVATVCGIEQAGATPVMVDIDPVTYTMDPAAAASAVTSRTKAIMPVHLYGHPAEISALVDLTKKHGLLLIEDCAQALGARYDGQMVGTFGDMSTYSFYPTKNLSACGDAGAVSTRDPELAARLRRLRMYGQVSRREAVERGINSRLDEIQAAILRVKLQHLDEHDRTRCDLAQHYSRLIGEELAPVVRPPCRHVWHLYVIRHPQRDELAERLAARGIGTLVHYPVPVHLQPAYQDLHYLPGSLPHTERAADEVLSLPLYIGLSRQDIKVVAQAVRECVEEMGP